MASVIAKLVLATFNPAKAREMRQILSRCAPSIEFLILGEFPGAIEADETGSTYAENALIKARAAAAFTGEWAVSDDAGLEIDALEGAPGLHSKRFEGVETDFPSKMRRILELMEGVPEDERAARFRCCVALCPPPAVSQVCEVFEAVCEGRIARQTKGDYGFGYDPIFYLPELNAHMAELPPEEKHKVSHRGKVLAMLCARLKRPNE
ncbi:MAG: dITP/XTP pyrophosphatase [Fimbriimonadaceae bacterium]|nr:dITP/XTP pyrophosphatase [Fimbriimonadaceae bacterium]QOJ12276.1 MAG: RdgB/HAM1 family non-canonical purine NTP pyrophosphatase [Chthonomonadaceae bacterium]